MAQATFLLSDSEEKPRAGDSVTLPYFSLPKPQPRGIIPMVACLQRNTCMSLSFVPPKRSRSSPIVLRLSLQNIQFRRLPLEENSPRPNTSRILLAHTCVLILVRSMKWFGRLLIGLRYHCAPVQHPCCSELPFCRNTLVKENNSGSKTRTRLTMHCVVGGATG